MYIVWFVRNERHWLVDSWGVTTKIDGICKKPDSRVDDQRLETFQTVRERPRNMSRSPGTRPIFLALDSRSWNGLEYAANGSKGGERSIALTRPVGIFFPDTMPREHTPCREWRQSRCRHRSAFTRSTRASWIPSSSTSKRRPSRSMTRSAGRSWRPG